MIELGGETPHLMTAQHYLPVLCLVHGLLAFVALYWLASECCILPSPESLP